MQFVYAPEGADPQTWDFEPGKLMNAEAEAIERHTGMTFGEWQEKVQKGSVVALHGLLFVMLKRQQPTLRYDQVVFEVGELDFQLSDDETLEAIDSLEQRAAIGELTGEERMLLEMLNASPAGQARVAAGERDAEADEPVTAHPEG